MATGVKTRSIVDRFLDGIFPGRAQSREFMELMNSDVMRINVGNTSYNCYSNARSLAKLGGAFVATDVLSSASVQRAATSGGEAKYDVGLGRMYEYSDAGFALNAGHFNREGEGNACKSLDGWNGWYGIDGSCLLFNFRLGMTFAYVPKQFEGRPNRFRAVRLLKAVVACESKQAVKRKRET